MKKYNDADIEELNKVANYLRRQSLTMIYHRQAGHPGGCLSAADIVAALYFHVLQIDPARPDWEDRDRFILSKGHASALLYSALACAGTFRSLTWSTGGNWHATCRDIPTASRRPAWI